MHVGHIDINNQKMSKSENNFVLVKELLDKYSGGDIRWFMYQTKYENPLNFSLELLEEAAHAKLKLYQQINLAFIQMALNNYKPVESKTILDENFINALDDDLDFPNAIAAI
jgi:cysteinyl-tRNA synthetase